MFFFQFKKNFSLQILITLACILIHGETSAAPLSAAPLSAAHFELEPSLNWSVFYEDNITGVSEKDKTKIGGFSNRYQPDLKFTLELPHCSIKGEMSEYVYRYFTEKQWDRTDKQYTINNILYLNHRSELTLSASYTINSNPEQFFTTEQGGGVLVTNFPIKTHSYSAAWNYKLTPRNTLNFMFEYGTFTSQFSSGSDSYSYTLNDEFILNKKDTLNLLISYENLKYNYTSAGALLNYTMDTYSIHTGFVHKFDESFKLSFGVGWHYSITKSDEVVSTINPQTGETIITGTETVTNNTTGSGFSLLLEKKYYYTTFQLRGIQSLFTDPDTGQTYPTLNFGVSINHTFTNKINGSLSWSLYQNKASAGDYNNRVKIDNKSYYTTATLGYIYNQNLTISLSYSYLTYKNTLNNDTSTRNTAYLQFTFSLKRPFIVE